MRRDALPLSTGVFAYYLCRALKQILLFLLTIVTMNAPAQFKGDLTFNRMSPEDSVWLINGYRQLGPQFKKQKLDFVLDGRQTLVSSTSARLGGLRIGIEYRRVHRFGVGIYNFGEGVGMTSLTEIDSTIDAAVLNLAYISLYYERVLFFNKRWEWSATLHLGRGKITGYYKYPSDQTWRTFPERDVRPIEISTTAYYNLTWWCSLGMGVGYRYMSQTPVEVRPIYNAPVAIARLRIKLGKLVRSIWDKNAKEEY